MKHKSILADGIIETFAAGATPEAIGEAIHHGLEAERARRITAYAWTQVRPLEAQRERVPQRDPARMARSVAKRIEPERCEELLDLLACLPIETQDETDRLRGPVLRLARAHRLTVYDAVYLDLAVARGLALATRDRALQQAARAEGVPLIET